MQNLGGSKTIEGQATAFSWRWYYHLPGVAFWAVVLLPLVLVKVNRQWRAWMILVPLLATMAAYTMLCRLSGAPAATEEMVLPFLMTLLTAWAIVWLMGDWLSRQRCLFAFGSAMLLMLATGLLSYASNFGTALGNLPGLLIYFTIMALSLIVPMAITARCCRNRYSPLRFMLWLLLWAPLVMVASILVLAVGMAIYLGAMTNMSNFTHILLAVPTAAMMGGIWGVALYVLNLGFMLLAFRNSLYHERLRSVLGLREKQAEGCPFAPTLSELPAEM